MPDTHLTTIRLPVELWQALQKAGIEDERSINWILKDAAFLWLDTRAARRATCHTHHPLDGEGTERRNEDVGH